MPVLIVYIGMTMKLVVGVVILHRMIPITQKKLLVRQMKMELEDERRVGS